MSMQVYEMAVTAEHALTTKPRRTAREPLTTNRGPSGIRRRVGSLAVAVIVSVLFLAIAAAVVANEAAAWGGYERGLTMGSHRPTTHVSGMHQRQATATTRYGGGGGTLATRQ